MAARTKLNQFYGLACLGVAALIGVLSGSWPIFLAALAVTVAGCLHAGDIRPRPGPRRGGARSAAGGPGCGWAAGGAALAGGGGGAGGCAQTREGRRRGGPPRRAAPPPLGERFGVN